jgi:uncharacterized YccA/Bax inhibitor family protein
METRMKSSNPAFSRGTFNVSAVHAGYGPAMTVAGTVNRAGILLMTIGAFGGLIAAMVTIFKKEWSPVSAPIYALLEGLFLGSFSAMMELRFPGIAIESVALTFGTCFCMLVAYRTGMIRVTQRFTMGLVAATGGIALIYFASMLLSLFHVEIPGIFGGGPIGIIFSLVVCAIAALNLVLDFDMIEEGARRSAPRYMEWYSAFGLMVTLVWLYLEIVRLLSKLRGDRR